MCVDQPWSHRITIMRFGEAHLQSDKQSLDLFISYRSDGGVVASVHICFFLSNSRSEKIASCAAFNIWSADTLNELLVCSEVWGISGDHLVAVLKS